MPQLEYQSFLGQRVRAAQLIIMDEMSMARRELFDAVENICRMTAIDGQNHLPFGGKMRLTQNMRVLPSAAAFAAWLEDLGRGLNCWAEPTEECLDLDRVELPLEFMCLRHLRS
uniref:ATP-dependent DNA helicase n=1 Tax=Ditylenchus dipsaci TaxID=166011 RepID=A0A915D9M1_9BILA